MLPDSVSKQVVLSYWATSAHITIHNNLPSRVSNALYSHSSTGASISSVSFYLRLGLVVVLVHQLPVVDLARADGRMCGLRKFRQFRHHFWMLGGDISGFADVR